MAQTIDVQNLMGEVVGSANLDETVWGIEPNIAVMHQAVVRQLANARLGTHDTQTRGEVRGGGRKPWRQKGTGRARQGSTRAPQWKGGGVVFGPHPRSYTQAMPRQMRRLALRSALSAKIRDERVTVLREFASIEPRTKEFKALLAALPESRSLLVVLPEKIETIERAAANLPQVKTIIASNLSVRDILKYERLVVAEEAVAVIEGLWAQPADKREPSSWKLARLAAKSGTTEPVVVDAAEEGA
ncbi:MAG: 50S ribosomal protein L4 [Thermomicrobiales bacterium]